jgi:hypothetical protein
MATAMATETGESRISRPISGIELEPRLRTNQTSIAIPPATPTAVARVPMSVDSIMIIRTARRRGTP